MLIEEEIKKVDGRKEGTGEKRNTEKRERKKKSDDWKREKIYIKYRKI